MAFSPHALDLMVRALLNQTVYVAFHTDQNTDPTDNTGEVSGGGYSRIAIPSTGWTFASGNDRGAASNSNSVDFGTTTAAWGNVTHYSVWLSLSGTAADDFLGSEPLSSLQQVESGDTVSIASGGVVLDINAV